MNQDERNQWYQEQAERLDRSVSQNRILRQGVANGDFDIIGKTCDELIQRASGELHGEDEPE